jgi:murein DD-endopeptidase MepM/ murein hydrolase activator NlpD
MKRYLLLILLLAAVSVLMGQSSSAQIVMTVSCKPAVVNQGGVCVVRASGPESLVSAHGEFQGEVFPMTRVNRDGAFRGLLGIDMSTAPGTYQIAVIARDMDQTVLREIFSLRVEKVVFAVQRLTLPPSKVDLDPKTLERVRREARRVKAVLSGQQPIRFWKGPFVQPVEGATTAAFGVRRILNGQERSPHTGVDLRAPEGTPIKACNKGVVVLVEDLFFSGRAVILDHGWGFYSMYSHLSKALVREGDTVAKGATIGLSGSSGRVTGPHLDWKIRLRGARVDPLSVLALNQYLEE